MWSGASGWPENRQASVDLPAEAHAQQVRRIGLAGWVGRFGRVFEGLDT